MLCGVFTRNWQEYCERIMRQAMYKAKKYKPMLYLNTTDKVGDFIWFGKENKNQRLTATLEELLKMKGKKK